MRPTIHIGTLLALGLGATPLAGQSELVLKDFFEGRSVIVKLDMPGSEDGVDVWPGTQTPVDFARYGDRIKRFGTSITAGRSVIVTKVHLKDKHIEFQLAGGGYGTFGDNTSTSISTPLADKTVREKNLEAELRRTTDVARKKAITEELDGLRKERERENARLRAMAAQAEQQAAENLRLRRLAGGSRFNIRYPFPIRPEEITPEKIMAALTEYLDFSPMRGSLAERPAPPAASGVGGLRKGLTSDEVVLLLGPAESRAERVEGTLKVVQAVYLTPQNRVEALFVEGVLVRYSISSR